MIKFDGVMQKYIQEYRTQHQEKNQLKVDRDLNRAIF